MIRKKLYIISVSMLLSTYSSVYSANRRTDQAVQDAEIEAKRLELQGKNPRNPEGQSLSEAYRTKVQEELQNIKAAVSDLSQQNIQNGEMIIGQINTVSEQLTGAVNEIGRAHV